MAGLFSRLKIWNPGEDLTASDLNAEFNHFLSNIDAEHSEGYSANLSEMQTVENPGGLGSENLTQPISVADEIQRLRFAINRIVGKSQWYESPSINLEGLESFVNAPASRVFSGQSSALSGFPKYLQAVGSLGVRINASVSTPMSVYIANALYTFTANITLGGLSSSQTGNTATLSSSFSGDQASREATRFSISSAGAAISSQVGKQGIFQIVNGSNTEYFLGTVASSTLITGIKRGYFFDTSNVAMPPIALTTGHTITLLRTTYVFLNSNGTLSVSYNEPTYAGAAPTSAVNGDYWFDNNTATWKVFNGTWIDSNAIYVGMCAQNTTQTICARSDNFYRNFSDVNSISLSTVSNTTVSTADNVTNNISVYGTTIKSDFKKYVWDITTNLISGESETSSTYYYLYLNDDGTPYMSFIKPISEMSMYGWYHPYEAMRCVGYAFNDAPSNLTQNGMFSFLSYYYPDSPPTVTRIINNQSVTFFGLTSFTAAAGDVYSSVTSGGTVVNYTVTTSVTSSTSVTCTYTGTTNPLNSATTGTLVMSLTRVTGSGTASSNYSTVVGSGTYITPKNAKYLRIRMVGGGGGGSSNTYSVAGSGGVTTFGGQSANGGGGGGTATPINRSGPPPGLASTIQSGFVGFSLQGSYGYPSTQTDGHGGQNGASSYFGGGGAGGWYAGTGAAPSDASPNTGSGGGSGGANSASTGGGASGASGAYVEIITTGTLSPTYSYAIGCGGGGGSGNTYNGADGAAGIIIVEEFYK
ncbi:MAG: hypothetical protein EBX40_00540 [Gammaproteobacteria bacterium]|nr:hypothetical protein [Gammaproteobacteria bacterium]